MISIPQKIPIPHGKVKQKNSENQTVDALLRDLARETLIQAGVWSLLTAELGSERAVIRMFRDDFKTLIEQTLKPRILDN